MRPTPSANTNANAAAAAASDERPTSPTPGQPEGRPSTNRLRRQGQRSCRGQEPDAHGHRRPLSSPQNNTLAKRGGSMETPMQVYSLAGCLAAGQDRIPARQSGQTDVDGRPCGHRRTRARPGPSKRVCPPAGAAGTRSPNVRPTCQAVPRPAPSRSAKSSKTPLGRRGGGGYPGVKVRVSGHLPDRSQSPYNLTGTLPRVSRFADHLPSTQDFSFFPPNIVENTKRERNRILLGL